MGAISRWLAGKLGAAQRGDRLGEEARIGHVSRCLLPTTGPGGMFRLGNIGAGVFRPKTPVNTYRANPVPPGGHLWKIGGPAEQRPKERGVRQKAEGRLGRTAAFGRPFGDHTRIAPPAAASAVESHSLG